LNEVRGTIQAADEFVDGSTLKHIAYNWAEAEVGQRHPNGPLGHVYRDQGIADYYAGRSRLLMHINGMVLFLARVWGIVANTITFRVPNIQDIKFCGKVFSQELFTGQPVLAQKKVLPDNAGFVTSDLQINPQTGKIVSGFLPAKDYIEPRAIFDPDSTKNMYPTKEERQYALWSKTLKFGGQ
jgi:hypothetical protein